MTREIGELDKKRTGRLDESKLEDVEISNYKGRKEGQEDGYMREFRNGAKNEGGRREGKNKRLK